MPQTDDSMQRVTEAAARLARADEAQRQASAELAHSSIRFSLHRFTTPEEVEYVGQRTVEVIKRLREMSPLYELAKEGVDLKSIKWKAE